MPHLELVDDKTTDKVKVWGFTSIETSEKCREKKLKLTNFECPPTFDDLIILFTSLFTDFEAAL